jgi:catechol 2,3-dioxygenase-like lactoylglutathione lyase family enzyme
MPAGGEPACRRFYGELLGMTELEKPPVLAARGGCWFRAAGVELHLGVEEGFTPARKAHPGILVVNLEALVARLAEAGIVAEPDPELPGYVRVYVGDPFGNRLEFLEPV